MTARITVTKMLQLIEDQKNIALNQPILILGNPVAVESFSSLTNPFKNATHNPDLFSFCTNPKDFETFLAQNVNKTLVFYLFKSDRIYQEAWFEESLKPKFEETTSFDVYSIDINKSKIAEQEKLREMNISKYPCVLTYKAGHLVDLFVPEMAKGSSISDQLAELQFLQKKKFEERPQKVKTQREIRDEEQIAFENRLREKEAQKRKQEERDKMQYLLEVKRKIAQDKKDRKKKYGK